MIKTMLTIGLFDKETCKQEINSGEAVNIISRIILDSGIEGATIIPNCHGIYQMRSTGEIIHEPSIRVEYVESTVMGDISFQKMIDELKGELNQESIMVEIAEVNVSFM